MTTRHVESASWCELKEEIQSGRKEGEGARGLCDQLQSGWHWRIRVIRESHGQGGPGCNPSPGGVRAGGSAVQGESLPQHGLQEFLSLKYLKAGVR